MNDSLAALRTGLGRNWQDSRGFTGSAVVGALALTYFGAAWAFVALANWAPTPTWILGAFTAPVVGLTAFSIVRLIAIGKRRGGDGSSARQGRRMGVSFAVIVAAEMVLIAGAATILARAERPLLIPIAVAAIVGVHFVPLARVFHVPAYATTGVLLIVSALGSLLIPDQLTRVFVLGIAVAFVLWASAATVLMQHTGRHLSN